MVEHVLLLGDVKGTKSLLLPGDDRTLNELEERIRVLQNAFALAFQEFARPSGSLLAATFSDSVLAEWRDYSEGIRYSARFARALWLRAAPIQALFRVFIDSGTAVAERDPIAAMLKIDGSRFVGLFSVSVAAWSVFMAESSHFPPGVFVGSGLAQKLKDVSFDPAELHAGSFRYRRIILSGEGAA